MIRIVRYSQEKKEEWDAFIKKSKNATFLFYRGYMDYHSDRFNDHSLLFYKEDKLTGLLPANESENILLSHAGLTYGSVLSDEDMTSFKMGEIFKALKEYLSLNKFEKLIYKVIPFFYHSHPAQEDLYFLFVNNASLIRRDISSTVEIPNALISGNKKRGHKKAIEKGVAIERSDNFEDIFLMANARLGDKYKARTVHTTEEMKLLAGRFPENIHLFYAKLNGEIIGGSINYVNKETVHSQYTTASEAGRALRVVDFINVELILNAYKGYRWFDLGISTENEGRFLNENLIKSKEELGGLGTCYDTYVLDI